MIDSFLQKSFYKKKRTIWSFSRDRFVKIDQSGLCYDQVLSQSKLVLELIQSIKRAVGRITRVAIDTH